ncbi:uncharacterized protein LOC103183429 [Callorhinchus milii]|uniref:uncharacterized protein LOC103183429 n=1 Tax=Callorhinchus milii TaxID=7868 RepID=UPI001C3F9022|nr:uncharacterized protein LOC103183429 [Callorhinchus milii]
MTILLILDSYIFILTFCLLPVVMTSPSGHRVHDGHMPNYARPFFLPPMQTQPMFSPPVSHFVHPAAFQPYFYPSLEYGGGLGLYYPVCPMQYTRSFSPHSPMPHTGYRRPYFNSSFIARPTFYQTTRFRHYNPVRRNVTNTEVQTDTNETNRGQTKRADPATESARSAKQTTETRREPSRSAGAAPAAGAAGAAAGEERPSPHADTRKEPSAAEQSGGAGEARSAQAGSYAFQKEEIRIECSEGAPSINVWRSFEATVPIYNATPSKQAEERIQCEVWSVSACDGAVPFYSPFVEGDTGTQRAQAPGEEAGGAAAPQARVPGLLPAPSQCPQNGCSECEAKGAAGRPPASADPDPRETNESQKPAGKGSSDKPAQPRGRGERERERERGAETDVRPLCPSPRREEPTCEVMPSDSPGSAESGDEYVPSSSVLAWLRQHARQYRWAPHLPQAVRDRPGIFSGSFDEMSSKDEESSSLDFFDAIPLSNQVSYSHLMYQPAPLQLPEVSASDPTLAAAGNQLESRCAFDREKVICSACHKEAYPDPPSESYAECRYHSLSRSLEREGSLTPGEQAPAGSAPTGHRSRKSRRFSVDSFGSKTKKKSRHSSDSEPTQEEPDEEYGGFGASPAEKGQGAAIPGSSRKALLRRTSKLTAMQTCKRPVQDKLKGRKRGAELVEGAVGRREAARLDSELQRAWQAAKPERKRKEKKKCVQKAMSVQNESEETADEYWNKVGAKPKSIAHSLDAEDSVKEYEKPQQKVRTIYKSNPPKRATKEPNEAEIWESARSHGLQGNAVRRGRTKKRY